MFITRNSGPRSLAFCFVIALTAVSYRSNAALNEDAVHDAMIRVLANGNASSGFMWGSPSDNYVVTALHTVLPKTRNIKISCQRNEADARIVKTLRKADLVLLQATESLADLGCKPYKQINKNRPPLKTPLYAFGFRPDNSRSAFSNSLLKGSGRPETLETMLPDKAVEKMRQLALPDIKLDLYYVDGGVFPGYSGGPVFNEQGELIGVVQGGLDKGLKSHDWLVPAKYIEELVSSGSTEVPNIRPSDFGYSSPAATATEANFVAGEIDGVQYKWVKTKTRTLLELLETADPQEGLDKLLEKIFPEIQTQAEQDLRFDIYQELTLGQIIAIPANRQLRYIEDDGDWALFAVKKGSSAPSRESSLAFHVNSYEVTDGGRVIPPSDPNFFNLAVSEYMKDCSEDNITCQTDTSNWQILNYGQDGLYKILRIGISEHTDSVTEYSYASLAVHGDNLFIADSRLKVGQGSNIQQCFDQNTESACGQTFWDDAALMVASHLTSFINTGSTDKTVLSSFDYECDNCDQATQQNVNQAAPAQRDLSYLTYYANNLPVTRQNVGNMWFLNINNLSVNATEYSRDSNNIILQYGNAFYSIPIAGGAYSQSVDGSPWSIIGEVQPAASIDTLAVSYYAESVELFQHQQGKDWFVNSGGQWAESVEYHRDLFNVYLQYGTSYLAVPLLGGQYFQSASANGPWDAVGQVSLSNRP
ncbi:MAG: serine protease [Pseudomonadota bacterium]